MQLGVGRAAAGAVCAVGLEVRELQQQLRHMARAFAGDGRRQAGKLRQCKVVKATRRDIARRQLRHQTLRTARHGLAVSLIGSRHHLAFQRSQPGAQCVVVGGLANHHRTAAGKRTPRGCPCKSIGHRHVSSVQRVLCSQQLGQRVGLQPGHLPQQQIERSARGRLGCFGERPEHCRDLPAMRQALNDRGPLQPQRQGLADHGHSQRCRAPGRLNTLACNAGGLRAGHLLQLRGVQRGHRADGMPLLGQLPQQQHALDVGGRIQPLP